MTLEDRYTENMENIYKETIKFIIKTLIDGFDEAAAELEQGAATDAEKDKKKARAQPNSSSG